MPHDLTRRDSRPPHQPRRAAVQREATAVAIRYEQDTAPCDGSERLAGILEAAEQVTFVVHGAELTIETRRALLELAGRTQAWLEHIAATETL